MSMWTLYSVSDDDEWVCHCVLCHLSFFYFDVSPHLSPLKWSWKESKQSMEVWYPPCMSQMVLKAANSVIYTMVLKWVNSPCQSQMVLKEVTYGCWFSLGPWPWPVIVFCRVPMVMFQLTGLKVHVRVLGQCHRVGWKLVDRLGINCVRLGLKVPTSLNWGSQPDPIGPRPYRTELFATKFKSLTLGQVFST